MQCNVESCFPTQSRESPMLLHKKQIIVIIKCAYTLGLVINNSISFQIAFIKPQEQKKGLCRRKQTLQQLCLCVYNRYNPYNNPQRESMEPIRAENELKKFFCSVATTDFSQPVPISSCISPWQRGCMDNAMC